MNTRDTSFLIDACVMPFCKGCGHTHVVRQLDDALCKLDLHPNDVCLVSDIGCIGLVDALFRSPHTVHTTHGRSTAFATGIELADSILNESRLKIVVLIGDGGAMIGLLHLVNAALLNVDVTVLLCNNFLFGMTGGQNSAFSPLDFITPTTPRGNMIPPLDMCRVLMDAHAGFVARKLATDRDLSDTIATAIAHPGFALVEIVELCTEYGVKYNNLSGARLKEIVESGGQQFGVLRDTCERDEFGKSYGAKFPGQTTEARNEFLTVKHDTTLDHEMGIVLAGTAGERVQSAAAIFCEVAVEAGLYCTLKTDNPVTQGTGFSFAEIKLSPREINYTGIESPDVIIAVSNNGWMELVDRGFMSAVTPSTIVLLDDGLNAPVFQGRIYRLPLRSMCKPHSAAAGALMFFLRISRLFSYHLYHSRLRNRAGPEVFPEKFLAFLENASVTLPEAFDSQN